jgi:hypothetical protein
MRQYKKIIYFKNFYHNKGIEEYGNIYEFDDNFAKLNGLIKDNECWCYIPPDPDDITVSISDLSPDDFNIRMQLQKDFLKINSSRRLLKKVCEKIIFEPLN